MCSQSPGLGSFGGLTAALTYDVVTDRLWVSSVAGDIWSCDLDGCNCTVEINATNMSDIGMCLV